jgi:hypothetical protein
VSTTYSTLEVFEMVSRKELRPYEQSKSGKQFSPTGLWKNELGSTMLVEQFDGTNFTGTYTSAVSAAGKSATGTLSGTIAGDAISFLVNWREEFASVTAWAGLVLSDGESPAIYALWHLASTPAEDGDAWESILAGADLFFTAE